MTGRRALPADLEVAWTAEVEWRDGRFSVVARRAGSAVADVLAESAPVAWPPAGAAEVQALTDAQRGVEAALADAGWKPLAPGDAWYSARFVWEPAAPAAPSAPAPAPAPASASWAPPAAPRADPGPFAPIPVWPDESKQRWRCEIKWDAGWIDSRFEAVTYRPRGRRGRAIGASSALKRRLMAQPDPDRPEDRAALDELAFALESAGWERVSQGAGWYSERFWWRHDGVPAERLDLADSDQESMRPDRGVSENQRPARIRHREPSSR